MALLQERNTLVSACHRELFFAARPALDGRTNLEPKPFFTMHRWNNLAFLPMTGVRFKMAKDENGRFHMGTLPYFLSAARVKYASQHG